MKDSCLELHCDVSHRSAALDRHVNDDEMKLIILGPFVLFSGLSLTSGSGEEIEEIDEVHITCLNYKC